MAHPLAPSGLAADGWPLPADPPPALLAAGIALALAAFALRELAAGALHAAGRDAWEWAKRRARKGRRP